MIKSKLVWIAACVALSATLAFQLLWIEIPLKQPSVVPVMESPGSSFPVERAKVEAPTHPFQQKLAEQQQHLEAKPHVVMNPNVGQDPFKAFLEKQSEMVHQSPFSK